MAQATPAVCQIPISPEDNCEVLTNGRCTTCGRAFCATHAAYGPRTGHRYSRCAICLAQALADAREQKRKAQVSIDEAKEYFESGAALTALLAAGVPPVAIHWVEKHREPKKGIIARGTWEVEKVYSCRGWVLGEFQWTHRSWIPETPVADWDVYAGHVEYRDKTLLTVLLDIPPSDSMFQGLGNGKLAGVKPVPGGYEAISFQGTQSLSWIRSWEDPMERFDFEVQLPDWLMEELAPEERITKGRWSWVVLAQTVKGLAGLPTP